MNKWCSNKLTVSGRPDAVAEFAVKARGIAVHDGREYLQPICFSNHAPVDYDLEPTYPGAPQSKTITHVIHAGSGPWWTGDESRLSVWGTAWEPQFDDAPVASDAPEADQVAETYPADVGKSGSVSYTFCTVDSAPIHWLQAASLQHPELRFELTFAEGTTVTGRAVAVEGQTIELVRLRVDELIPQDLVFD